MATAIELLTVEEYAKLSDGGRPTELVRGQVIEMNPPSPKHGRICLRTDRLIGNFVEARTLERVVCNDYSNERPRFLRRMRN